MGICMNTRHYDVSQDLGAIPDFLSNPYILTCCFLYPYYTNTCTDIWNYIQLSLYSSRDYYECVWVYIDINIYVYTYVYIYMCIYIYIYVYIYIYINFFPWSPQKSPLGGKEKVLYVLLIPGTRSVVSGWMDGWMDGYQYIMYINVWCSTKYLW